MYDMYLLKNIWLMDKRKIAKNYKYLGEGIGRKVYAINENYVIKIAKSREGAHQNIIEHHVYTQADRILSQYLCPIIWCQPDRLIMRRAKPLSKHNKCKYVNINRIQLDGNSSFHLKRLANTFFLYYEDIISTSSWGIYNNQKVLIDYGCASYQGDVFYKHYFRW